MSESNDEGKELTPAANSSHLLPTEAVILAGGLGTRLRSVVPDVPKVLAPVAGKPFLTYVINYFRMQGIQRFVFALGYGAVAVEAFLRTQYPTLDYATVTEPDVLGTGGAVRLALQKAKTPDVVIANGDTVFEIDLEALFQKHLSVGAACTLAVKPMPVSDRFSVVDVDEESRVVFHQEKAFHHDALVNGGIYIVNTAQFFQRSFPQKFSFERDYLEAYCNTGAIYALTQDVPFIDIGVPEDYQRAQVHFSTPALELAGIDKTWTLFIDRDGVINDETLGEYVLHWDQFIFSKGVLHSFKQISEAFARVFIVTNQKGVGRGLMTQEALDTVHHEMQREVAIAGGRIDKIYFCTDTSNQSFFRKPNPGMAFRAKKDFPQIDLRRSIMVGNKRSDMQFGRAAGMYTVFLATTNPEEAYPQPNIDLRFNSLAEFAAALPSSV